MTTIVHRIQLLDGVDPERFERWVRDVDYAACPELPSVLAFAVQRVVGRPVEPSAGGKGTAYFEIIEVTSREEFERDMESACFQRLVAAFDQMAKVVDEAIGERVGAGYRAEWPVK